MVCIYVASPYSIAICYSIQSNYVYTISVQSYIFHMFNHMSVFTITYVATSGYIVSYLG